eukprot:TRINITY_DN4147_c0_g1_i3.p1 TRINITY_DN4147_c0_g1~~TRINITY_DN4147_c0_g1_i3.p1  ORF type:complete len:644 (+),score=127.25 TRINITY_DN4147_c0_g1_i3:56-1987(+)
MGRWRNAGHGGRPKDKDSWKTLAPGKAERLSGSDDDAGQRLTSPPSSQHHGGSLETLWASRVIFEPGAGQLKLGMSRLAMTDEGAKSWCSWFRTYLASIDAIEPWVAQVDFAENRLTAKGLGYLLETFRTCEVAVIVLKLHHNRIAEGGSLAAFLRRSSSLQELHLSHNDLDAKASAEIIAASAAATDSEGNHSYPRHTSSRGLAPLWVRLEQNLVDYEELGEIMATTYPHLSRAGSPKLFCDASSKWCTPHSCAVAQQAQAAPPVVHLKNLYQQRRRPANSMLTDSSQSSCSSAPAPGSRAPASAPALGSKAAASAPAPESRAAEEVEFARIHRWDWNALSWIPDVIEVPPKESFMKKRSHESKHEHQENLSLGLKALIGIGMGKPKLDDQSAESSDAVHNTVAESVHKVTSPKQKRPQSDAKKYIGANLLRALRGGEMQPECGINPFSPEFALNPQAPEFKPSLPLLNPAAPEFMPQAPPPGLDFARAPPGREAARTPPGIEAARAPPGLEAARVADADFHLEVEWFTRHAEPRPKAASWEPEATQERTIPLPPGLPSWSPVHRALEDAIAEQTEETEVLDWPSERACWERHAEHTKDRVTGPLQALVSQLSEGKKQSNGEPPERESLLATADDLKGCTTS